MPTLCGVSRTDTGRSARAVTHRRAVSSNGYDTENPHRPVTPKQANLLTRIMYRVAKRRFGEVPEPFAVAAHHPRLLVANAVHETLLQSGVEEAARQRPRAGGVLDRPHHRLLVVRRLRLDAASGWTASTSTGSRTSTTTQPLRLHRRRARRDRLRRCDDDRPAHRHRRAGRRPTQRDSATRA